MFGMSETVKKVIMKASHDIKFMFGKAMSVEPFHRVYHLDWNKDGTLRYWTPGLKKWQDTKLTRESIDLYYDVVATQIDKSGALGPRPTTKHINGKQAYSPGDYCDFSDVCDIRDDMSPDEFKDRASVITKELWEERR